MDVSFIHLHTHSHYSLLDGAGKIDQLVERAKTLSMPALAITDHGNLYGALEFYQIAKKEGIKPIIGYEAYIANGSRKDKSAGSQKNSSTHLTLLALNQAGYKNLLKLSSVAFLEGFYYKPRIDREILEQYNEGLICLSGCASSEVARLVAEDTAEGFAKAKEVALWYQQLFGDRYYLEIQNHGLISQKAILSGTLKLAAELGIPTVATNDVHYIKQEDYDAQDLLLCVNTGKLRNDPERIRMYRDDQNPHAMIDQFFFRSGKEMLHALPGQEDAIARTMEIADRVNIELDLGKRYFPVFTPPGGLSSDDYLRQLCIEGLKKRYAGNPKRYKNGQLSEEVIARLDRELFIIAEKGYPTYFLIVWDIVRVAEERGIHHTARGSGVGALVCYALNMSHVCPLEYDLLFERFLALERQEAPDIDIDFDQDRRGEILDYITETYSKENVARLGTFGTMGAKSSIKDVGRALDLPIAFVTDVTKLIPDKPGTKIGDTLNGKKNKDGVVEVLPSEELKKRYEEEQIKTLLDFAQKLEGTARNTGVHACGVIIADKPLTEYVPLQLDKKEGIVTQWEGKDIEAAGLLKMDILGLQNLTILAHSIELIKQTTGTTIDPYQLPLDDKKTYELFCRGETKGIFQFESGGMREYLQRLKPDNFRDIIAMAAMYRPGPMDNIDDYIAVKHGKTKATYEHPVLEKILTDTNGIMVYQEQIMQVLNQLGDIPLGDAYSCIKAISKKKDFSKFRADFIAGSEKNGLPEKKADGVFDLIREFANYGFNKSHATAYALIAYITAYLKVHYPVEFMAALLCGDISGRNFSQKDSTVIHKEDCERMGIKIIPPDVNSSKQLYTVVDGKIAFALTAIKGCGDWAADRIVCAREKGGTFKDLFDFCERVDNKACNKAAIESLIKAGAFDSMGFSRASLFQTIEMAMKAGQGAAEDAAKGQGSLFGGDDETTPADVTKAMGLPRVSEWTDKEKSTYEKDVLGFYLTSHPLQEYVDIFSMFRSHECSEAVLLPDKTPVVLAGAVSDIKTGTGKNAKQGKPSTYAMFTLEDTSGSVRSIMWADSYSQYSHLIKNDSIVFMRGRTDRSRCATDDSPDGNFIVDDAFTVEEAPTKLCRGLAITLDVHLHGKDSVEALKKIFQSTPGNMPVEFFVHLDNGATATFRGGKTTVGVTPELYRQIMELLKATNMVDEDATDDGESGEESPPLVKILPTIPMKKPQNGYRRAN